MKLQTSKNNRMSSTADTAFDTSTLLEKAQTGQIPVLALRKFALDQREVSMFLARELLFLHSAAEGAKMRDLAVMLYELHASLVEKVKLKPPTPATVKIQARRQNENAQEVILGSY
jgi:hypothetical protein